MNYLLLVVCLYLTGCYAAGVDTSASVNAEQPQERDKGLIEWVANLFGGVATTSKPVVTDPVPTNKDCPPCQCGIANTRRRIVGGYETKERQYPWMAMLMYNGRFFCGASLISDFYLLTAAHCTGLRKDRMTVRLLEHDVTDRGNDTKIIDKKVAKVIRHERYNPGTYDNDIALIKLSERIDLSNAIKKKRARSDDGTTVGADTTTEAHTSTEAETTTAGTTSSTQAPPEEENAIVRPVCLPAAGLSYTEETALVIGWGVTEQGGYVSNTLQEVKVPIVSNQECRERSYGGRITENMLCAGDPKGGRDACQGDSGGPLHVFNETSGKYHEVGVVSWGEGCAQPDKYGVYSRVNRYLAWIKSNTADGCYCD